MNWQDWRVFFYVNALWRYLKKNHHIKNLNNSFQSVIVWYLIEITSAINSWGPSDTIYIGQIYFQKFSWLCVNFTHFYPVFYPPFQTLKIPCFSGIFAFSYHFQTFGGFRLYFCEHFHWRKENSPPPPPNKILSFFYLPLKKRKKKRKKGKVLRQKAIWPGAKIALPRILSWLSWPLFSELMLMLDFICISRQKVHFCTGFYDPNNKFFKNSLISVKIKR